MQKETLCEKQGVIEVRIGWYDEYLVINGQDFSDAFGDLLLEVRNDMAVVLAYVMAVPASVERAVVVRVGLIVRLHGQIARAHDTLSQVVDAVQVMAVVVARQTLGHIALQAGKDARHHELFGLM